MCTLLVFLGMISETNMLSEVGWYTGAWSNVNIFSSFTIYSMIIYIFSEYVMKIGSIICTNREEDRYLALQEKSQVRNLNTILCVFKN